MGKGYCDIMGSQYEIDAAFGIVRGGGDPSSRRLPDDQDREPDSILQPAPEFRGPSWDGFMGEISDMVEGNIGIPAHLMREAPAGEPSWKTFTSLDDARASSEPSFSKVFIGYPSGNVFVTGSSDCPAACSPSVAAGLLSDVRSFADPTVCIPFMKDREMQPQKGILALVREKGKWVLFSEAEVHNLPSGRSGRRDPCPVDRVVLPAECDFVHPNGDVDFQVSTRLFKFADGMLAGARETSEAPCQLLLHHTMSPFALDKILTPTGQDIYPEVSSYSFDSHFILTMRFAAAPLDSRYLLRFSKERTVDDKIAAALDDFRTRIPSDDEIEDWIGDG